VVLLAFGFGYYVYNTAERKGWFVIKAPYFTFVDTAAGLKVGDPVMLMGFDAGTITEIKPMPAEQFTYNVCVKFELKAPNYGYIWTEGSRAKVATADLLGKRVLEVSKGTNGYPSYVFFPLRRVTVPELPTLPDLPQWVLAEEIIDAHGSNLLAKPWDPLINFSAASFTGYSNLMVMDTNKLHLRKLMTGIWNDQDGHYDFYTNGLSKAYWLISDESPAVTEQLQRMVGQVEQALPHILVLTNQLATVLANSASLTSNLNVVALAARPAVSNLAAATAHLDRPGGLGEWLLPTNTSKLLEGTLTNASATLASANSNLTSVAENLNRTLDNLAAITSNLNQQVEANTNMLSSISGAVTHADEFVQGLKRFWLFRHLFKAKDTNAPPAVPPQPLRSPKDKAKQ
jgi:ABC-type transporter Mla subunit MlaD